MSEINPYESPQTNNASIESSIPQAESATAPKIVEVPKEIIFIKEWRSVCRTAYLAMIGTLIQGIMIILSILCFSYFNQGMPKYTDLCLWLLCISLVFQMIAEFQLQKISVSPEIKSNFRSSFYLHSISLLAIIIITVAIHRADSFEMLLIIFLFAASILFINFGLSASMKDTAKLSYCMFDLRASYVAYLCVKTGWFVKSILFLWPVLVTLISLATNSNNPFIYVLLILCLLLVFQYSCSIFAYYRVARGGLAKTIGVHTLHGRKEFKPPVE